MSTIGSSGSLNSSGIQFSGLASGVDTNKLVEGLVAIQRGQVARLQASQLRVSQQQATFKAIESRLLTLQGQATKLGRTFNTVFDGKTATSNNKELATAAASASAAPGVYAFRVNTLAKAQTLATQGFADANSTINQGTVQIKIGSGGTTTVTIDASNNTLQGLAAAINASGAEATASIVNEGSGATPYKLLLTAKKTGAVNTIAITNDLTSGGATQPQLTTTVQAAADASIKLGSGAGEITVTNATNQIAEAFSGVTLNLAAADPAKEVSITVAQDTETAKTAVKDFIGAYNELTDLISAQTGFDAQTNQAGVLLGNSYVAEIQNAVTTKFTSIVGGVSKLANRLSTVGVTLDDKGKLNVDDTKLTNALTGKVSGVTLNDVRRLFALDGVSTSSGVQFISANSTTKVPATPIQVDITQAATRASVLGTALTGPVTIAAGSNELSLTLDSRTSSTLSLAAGSYTLDGLAQELQAKINADSQLAGAKVAVSVENSRLKITSEAYGAISQVTIGGGSAVTAGVLGFTGGETAAGQDVAGTFTVNGAVETGVGYAQTLTGSSTNANTAGLQVRVTLSSGQVQAGLDADLTLTRGLGAQLDIELNKFLDPVNGRLKSIDKTFQDSVDSLQESIDRQNARITARQEALVRQFAAMEAIVSKLKNTGDYLVGQFASLNKLK